MTHSARHARPRRVYTYLQRNGRGIDILNGSSGSKEALCSRRVVMAVTTANLLRRTAPGSVLHAGLRIRRGQRPSSPSAAQCQQLKLLFEDGLCGPAPRQRGQHPNVNLKVRDRLLVLPGVHTRNMEQQQ